MFGIFLFVVLLTLVVLYFFEQYKIYEDSISIKVKMSGKDLLDMVKDECEKNGVEFITCEENRISYPGFPDMKVSGYFTDKPKPALACALGKPEKEWMKILIHEFSHMRQWLEKSELWDKQYANGIDCDKGMDEWLSGKEFTKEEYTYFVRTIQELEYDCERRTLSFIVSERLPIDPEEYIKNANSYIFLYSVLLETKKWPDVAPYEVKEIMDMMPSFFFKNFEDYFELNEKMLELYKEKCYNK
jgi:hypothetical protein